MHSVDKPPLSAAKGARSDEYKDAEDSLKSRRAPGLFKLTASTVHVRRISGERRASLVGPKGRSAMSQNSKVVRERDGGDKLFRPRRLGHTNLVVGNLERSMAFHTEVVGLEVAYVQPHNRAGFLSNGNTHHDIGMVEGEGPLGRGRAPGLIHVAFELETEVDLVDGYERATGAGIEFERMADHDIAHAVYGRDPDGNQYEIYADVFRDWRAARSGIVTKPKPNWKPGDTPVNEARNYHPDPEIRWVEDAVFHPCKTIPGRSRCRCGWRPLPGGRLA
jgi:catechol 2,3-dioxygenase-like lactoylglutathione lyase family enzyme